jgi:hypothetical protein
MVGISKRSRGFRGREPFPSGFGKGKPKLTRKRRNLSKIKGGLKQNEATETKPVSLGQRELARRRKFIVERKTD